MGKIQQSSYLLVKEYISTLKIEQISFLVLDSAERKYSSLDFENFVDTQNLFRKLDFDVGSPIAFWLSQNKKPLILSQIEEMCKAGSIENTVNLEAVKSEMKRNSIYICIPVVSNNVVRAILALKKKENGDEDIGWHQLFANFLELAFENSKLSEDISSISDHNYEILEAMTDGVFTVDLSGKIITFNKTASKITEIDAGGIAGKTCAEIWGDSSVINNLVGNTLLGNIFINFETSIVTKGRGLIPIRISTTLLKDRIGRSDGVLVIISDLSEVKQLEHRVRQSDKLAALGTLAAGMAHEIKNPLSSMKVLSQLMAKKFSEDDFRNKFIEIMPREIGRIDRIIESLLGFARATSPRLEEVRVPDILDEAFRFLAEQIKAANVEVKKEIEQVPIIIGDVQQLIQVFVNLFLNAIQAMPEGGMLKVSVKNGTVEEIHIEVSDTGHGIPKEYLSKLFDPFFTTKYGGTGLGLTIVHSIIEGHGGEIIAESEFGSGTRFKIMLPRFRGR